MTKKTSKFNVYDLTGIIAGVVLRDRINNKEEITAEETKNIIIASFGLAKGLLYLDNFTKKTSKKVENERKK